MTGNGGLKGHGETPSKWQPGLSRQKCVNLHVIKDRQAEVFESFENSGLEPPYARERIGGSLRYGKLGHWGRRN